MNVPKTHLEVPNATVCRSYEPRAMPSEYRGESGMVSRWKIYFPSEVMFDVQCKDISSDSHRCFVHLNSQNDSFITVVMGCNDSIRLDINGGNSFLKLAGVQCSIVMKQIYKSTLKPEDWKLLVRRRQ